MPIEKRQHKRYKGKEGAFAAFLRPTEPVNLGNIVDISMGGLCARYVSMNGTDCECTGVKIFGFNGHSIHLDRIECEVIYDEEIPNSSWSQLNTRRCGIMFKDLSASQSAMLQDFMNHFTHYGI